MKRSLSIVFAAAILAAATAFAGKAHSSAKSETVWLLNDNNKVTGFQSDIKVIYCSGPNDVQCAVNLSNPFNVIYKP